MMMSIAPQLAPRTALRPTSRPKPRRPKAAWLAAITWAWVGYGAALAQTAGSTLVRVGAVRVTPSVTSGDLSPPAFIGAQAQVTGSSVLGGGISYMLDDHVALDIPLAQPLRLDITGSGSVSGVGKLGETQALPITLLAQYRWGPAQAALRPYLGAGLTYARFYQERATNILSALAGGTPTQPVSISRIDPQWGTTVQLGATIALSDRCFADVMVSKTWLKTTAHLSSGQHLDLRLDPSAIALGLGWRY
jgi:outer membrane protein